VSSIEVDPELVESGDQALIAIIDEGIDIFHEAFLDESGKTRIMEIWDQTDFPDATIRNLGIPGSLESFGRVHTKEEINRYIADKSMPDTLARYPVGMRHGTKVASIAAGSRIDNFSGIAPKSKIIVVIPLINKHLNFDTAYDLAFRYIKQIATTEPYKNPVVVNISQGLNLEGHDGTSEKSC
jgi:Subtilase family